MNTETLDFLVVGQGLAGSLLAWELARRGQRALVVDEDWRDSSSTVAAGLVNPVIGKRLTLHADTPVWLRHAHETYSAIEAILENPLFHLKPVLRLFIDEQQRDYFFKRQSEEAQRPFWSGPASDDDLAPFSAPWGGAWQTRTGYLDTSAFLSGIRSWLVDRGALRRERFDYADLEVTETGVRWRGLEARELVFCEGIGGLRNPWFGTLPYQPAKGEILTLEWRGPAALPDAVVHKGIWLAPRPDGRWRLGATHQWDPLDTQPTAEGAKHLMEQLADLVPRAEAHIVDHSAGVRPATRDRAPFLGRHHEQPRLSVFNGFGAKGSLMIPYCAAVLADHLCYGKALPNELDIRRCG